MAPGDRFALLVDFGSTYTKVRALNLTRFTLAGSAQGPSTVTSDVTIGLQLALQCLERSMGSVPQFEYKLASSSAAGGLRMVTIGLVPELTAEAARLAALGAGAKVVGVFSYDLTDEDVSGVLALKPDVVLLAGGTDGGNTAVISRNARQLADSAIAAPIIVAGNRNVTSAICDMLSRSGKRAIAAANVMPSFGVIDIQSAQSAIREVFLDQIVHAKGLDRASSLLDGGVTMPTPVAVLQAAKLLAEGPHGKGGMGDLVVVDPGGATTDIHSACAGLPSSPRIIPKGLPEPYLKRTVEGDLGLRHNARSILDAEGAEGLARLAGISASRVEELVEALHGNVESLPVSSEQEAVDFALGRVAIDAAMDRHAGRLEIAYSNEGPVTFQHGKDLTHVRTLIGTGGVLAHGRHGAETLKAALSRDSSDSVSLRPRNASLHLDRDYLLFACGLLAEHEPEAAFNIATGHLRLIGSTAARPESATTQDLEATDHPFRPYKEIR